MSEKKDNKIQRKRQRLFAFLFYVNLINSLFLLIALFSIYFNPEYLVFPLYFGLTFLIWYVINVFFVFVWIKRRNLKRLLLPVILFVVTTPVLSNVFSLNISGVNNISSQTLKILSYNVRLFDRYQWIGDKQIPQKITNFVNEQCPDVACLQEYYSGENSAYTKLLKNTSGFTYSHTRKTGDTDKKVGFATFSKYPIVNKGAILFENKRCIAIYSDIVVEKDTLRIINCHTASVHLGYDDYKFIDNIGAKDENKVEGFSNIFTKMNRAFKKRVRQVHIIGEAVRTSPYRVIVCGDFNDTPVSYTYHYLSNLLSDAFVDKGFGLSNTYVHKFSLFRIDYIFHDSSLKTLAYRRHKIVLSDHYPITAIFSVD